MNLIGSISNRLKKLKITVFFSFFECRISWHIVIRARDYDNDTVKGVKRSFPRENSFHKSETTRGKECAASSSRLSADRRRDSSRRIQVLARIKRIAIDDGSFA